MNKFATYEELYDYLELASTYRISVDSRKTNPGDIFVAIKGEFFDGNKFAAQSLEKGAKYVIIDDSIVLPPHKQDFEVINDFSQGMIIIRDQYILVDNTILALQRLARIHRNRFPGLVVAITGSCGKTTTKELLNDILSTKFKVYANPGNYNSHIGLPIALLQMPLDMDIAIFEMGARNIGDIALLCDIARPNIGLITNIKNVHLQGLKDIHGVYKVKIELFNFLLKTKGEIFLNVDENSLLQYFKESPRTHIDYFHFYGHLHNDNLKFLPNTALILKKYTNNNSPYLHYYKPNNTEIVTTNILGNFNIYNIAAALKIAAFLGVASQKAHNAIKNFKNPTNRLELMYTNNNIILLDAYNSNFDSVLGAIDILNKFKINEKVLILGDINELGELSNDIHHTIYKEAINLANSNLNYSRILLCGPNFYKAYDKYIDLRDIHQNKILFFKDKQHLEQFLKEIELMGKTILIKASRSLQLETLINLL